MKPLRLAFFVLALGALAAPLRADETYRLLTIDNHPVKWGAPKLGSGAVITYRLAPRGAKGGQDNCRVITPVAPLLARSRISQAAFDAALDDALQSWENVADVRFVRVDSGKPANLTISAEQTPEGIAYTDVTQASPTKIPVATLSDAVVCLNPRLHWAAHHTPAAKGDRVLSYVLAHEIGHALGLDHPGPAGQLMSFEYSDTIQTQQAGDIAGIVLLYGPASHHGAVALNAPSRH